MKQQRQQQQQRHLRLVTGAPLRPPRAPRRAPDGEGVLEFLLRESLRVIDERGCVCYLKAKYAGRRHNKQTCKCKCGHPRRTRISRAQTQAQVVERGESV